MKPLPPDSRSPLKAAPLRNPGQSLDEEINRILDEDMLSYFMVAVFLLAITLMEWLRWWLNLPPQPLVYTVITVVVIAYVARKLFVLRRKIRQLRLARDGERAVGQYLEILRARGYRVLHDLVGDGFNVDHVLIGPTGMFTVETKTYRKSAKGAAEIVYDGERVTIAGRAPERDPVVQGKAQAHWLRDLLRDSTGRAFVVRAVVLYPGWFVKITAKPHSQMVWVLNPKALPSFLEHQPASLTEADVQLATYHLSRFIRASAT